MLQQVIQASNPGGEPTSVRVTMSALATQLASPPAIISTAQGYNFQSSGNSPQLVPGGGGGNTKQLILNSTNTARLLNQSGVRRQEVVNIASPGSDISNTSNSSAASNNYGITMTTMGALLATSPSPIPGDLLAATSPQQNQQQQQQQPTTANSALIERLTSNNSGSVVIANNNNLNNLNNNNNNNNNTTSNSLMHQQQQQQQQHQQKGSIQQVVQSPGPSPIQFTAPSPKQMQQIQVQSPAPSISPLSSPPPQQINLQGLNLASIQGAMASIPGLQNVQVSDFFYYFRFLALTEPPEPCHKISLDL